MADVPCGSCTACCRGPDRELRLGPEDDPNDWDTYEQRGGYYLARKENGDCLYLGDEGCTIYEKRPVVCREFDCRYYVENPNTPKRVRDAGYKLILDDPEFVLIMENFWQVPRVPKKADLP